MNFHCHLFFFQNVSMKFVLCFAIDSRFQTAYHGRAQTALPYAMNSEFSRVLSAEMVSYTWFSRG